jgi:predicted AAA+ superfamily ATPase
MHGLTEREAGNRLGTGLLTKIIEGDLGAVATPDVAPDLYTYVDRATRSGFPFPRLHLTGVARTRWLSSYLDDVTTRDVVLSGERRDPLRLRRYLEVLGLSSAGLPTLSTLTEAADLDGRTVNDYDRLLQRLYLLDLVPAWSSNRLSRLVKTPKRYLTDPALALAAAGLDAAAVLASADQLGRTLDSLVAGQVRPELVNHVGARLSHLRTDGGRQEIDLLVELGAGRVVALEVKAGTAPSLRDARHLIWLRDQLGGQFVRGVVLHTGSGVFELSDRVWALPIAAWWG